MGYVEILTLGQTDLAGNGELPTDVIVGLSPDEVATDQDEFTDWMGGYMLTRSLTPSRHDGYPATLVTLHDSGGDREVGRLVLRNDALRDARLEVKRIFDKPEQREAWVAGIGSKPAAVPDGYTEIPARAIMAGDRIFIEGDPSDPDVNDTTAPVTAVNVIVTKGAVEVAIEIGEAEEFNPCSGGVAYYAPLNDLFWVKRG